MAEILIKRDGDESWHAPATSNVSAEDELQALLASSPELLPGPEGIPLVAVREFPVQSGYVDIVAVAADGSIVVVECKLRANPEIRRQVLGQVLAYASSLWQMPFEQFEASFEGRAGRSLLSLSEEFEDDQWSVDEFRKALAANLQSGAFRVVVAVDEITDELRRTISYLNTHTSDELELVALELGYIRDGDVEMLIPTVYGEEAAITKREARTPKWNEEAFWEHAEAESSPEVLAAIRELHEWAVDKGSSFYWGEGKFHPSMTAWVPPESEAGPVWSCYLADGDSTLLGLNFEWLSTRASEDRLARLADDLRAIPEAAALLTSIEERGFRKRPSLPVSGVLTRPEAMAALITAYDRFVSSDDTGSS